MAGIVDGQLMDMFYLSETKPRIRESLISREPYLDFLDSQLEERRVLCVEGEEGVGVTTALALFARRHGNNCASYFNNGWSRHSYDYAGNRYQVVSLMKPQEPITPSPITEIPDYVWFREYDKPCFIPGRPVQKPKEEGRRISHPDAESALQAAKRACRSNPGRWFGRASSQADSAESLVYENGKVVERHVVGR